MRRSLRRMVRVLLVLIVICIVLFFVFRSKYTDAVQDLAQTQVMNSTSDLINDSIDRQIELGNIQYNRIVFFEKDLNGRITALKTNMSEVNRLKTDILNRINDEILAMDTSMLGVPLGSLFFPEFFSGRGPSIPVEILSIRKDEEGYLLTTNRREIPTRYVINCAGIHSAKIAAMVHEPHFSIHPRSGEYILCNRDTGKLLNKVTKLHNATSAIVS